MKIKKNTDVGQKYKETEKHRGNKVNKLRNREATNAKKTKTKRKKNKNNEKTNEMRRRRKK